MKRERNSPALNAHAFTAAVAAALALTGAAPASAQSWHWDVQLAHPAGATKSHIHAANCDTDASSRHFYVGCSYNGSVSTAKTFDPGGYTWYTLPGGTQSQVYGIRGRSAAGTVMNNSVWQAVVWTFNGSTWLAPKMLAQSTWAYSTANDVDGYQMGGTTDTAVGCVRQTATSKTVPCLWSLTPTPQFQTLAMPSGFDAGTTSGIDIGRISGSAYRATGNKEPHALSWSRESFNNLVVKDLHPTIYDSYGFPFPASMANDTFRWNVVGTVGYWSNLFVYGGHAVLWNYDGKAFDLHNSAYKETGANGLNGNAVVGFGRRLVSGTSVKRALYWPLPNGTVGNAAPIELPMPTKPGGGSFKHTEAYDIVADGAIVVGIAYDTEVNGSPTDEQAVVWELVYN